MVLIENKIYAGEEHEQLHNYASYMADQNDLYPHQVLVYLTLDGEPSKTAGGAAYVPLSHRQDIQEMLAACLPAVQSARVRESIEQYRKIINNL